MGLEDGSRHSTHPIHFPQPKRHKLTRQHAGIIFVIRDVEVFADGQGANARFNGPCSVAVAANGDIFVSGSRNHAILVITPQGAVRTLCCNEQSGFADAQGADALFNDPGCSR